VERMVGELASLNERLARGADRMARLSKLERQQAGLESEVKAASAAAARLKAQLAKEEADVDALSGASLAGLFHSLLGEKDERLLQERQEAVAAQLKYDAAVRQQQTLAEELDRTRSELRTLQGVKAEHTELLQQKEAAIGRSSGPGARQLFGLGERENTLRWEAQQLSEAITAGSHARQALQRVVEALEGARGFGTWDLLGGGLIATALKHGRLDDARDAAHEAQGALSSFRRELQDVAISVDAEQIAVDGFTRFADFFFDGLIADWIVQSRINQSLEGAQRNHDLVVNLVESLRRRAQAAQAELAAVQQERAVFIEQYRPS